MQAEDFGKTLVVSPHLDDAVLSCADLIATLPAPTVLTVFAGVPVDRAQHTPWDAASGFADAGQAIATRRDEDRRALALLGATPAWLDFCDSQYRATPALSELEQALQRALHACDPATVLLPAGLFHSDHLLVHRAMLNLSARFPHYRWRMYEEAMYRRIPGLLQQRLDELRRRGFAPVRIDCHDGGASPLKREAVQCYASQLRALSATVHGGHADAFQPESYWRLPVAAATPSPGRLR